MEFLPKQEFLLKSDCSSNYLIKYEIPFEIKNDLIYCQKTLRTYLKVYDMAIKFYGQKISTALPTVRRLLDDLEGEIYEINAEQHFLIFRLRKSMDEFYKGLPINPEMVNRNTDNAFLRHTFSKYVDDPNYPCEAISVKTRKTFNQWKRKFCFDDPKRMFLNEEINANKTTTNKPVIIPENPKNSTNVNGMPQQQQQNIQQQKSRVSLLKPKSEREIRHTTELDQMNEIKYENDDQDFQKMYLQRNSFENKNIKLDKTEVNLKTSHERDILIKPSSAMNIGRMKLLQALNKAKNQKEVAPVVHQTTPSTSKIEPKVINSVSKSTITKIPEQQKLSPKFDGSSTSSDDSLDGIIPLPAIDNERPENCNMSQEMFLRQFGLYTLEHSSYLKQRRSKRRRRNVQMNGRKDYHYGNLKFAALDAQTAHFPKEKKKKIFLASPTLARKNAKRNRISKDEKPPCKVDRSSSSSPDQKIFCNVCFRNNEDSSLKVCKKCKQHYHISCHSKFGIKTGAVSLQKFCPVCLRAKKSSRSASSEEVSKTNSQEVSSEVDQNKVRRSSLVDQCNELKQKIASAQMKKNLLLKEGESYKSKMNQIFSIVDEIKGQDETPKLVEKKKDSETIVFEIEISDDDDDESTTEHVNIATSDNKCIDNIELMPSSSASSSNSQPEVYSEKEDSEQITNQDTNDRIEKSDSISPVFPEKVESNVIDITDSDDDCLFIKESDAFE